MANESILISEVIPASPERIFAAWLDSAEHSAITGAPASVTPSVGGEHRAHDGYIQGRTLELNEGSRIVQSWRTSEFPDGSPDSRLEITLEPTLGGTLVTLLHTDIPGGQSEKYKQGWDEFYLSRMKLYFAGGAESEGAAEDADADEGESDDLPQAAAPAQAAPAKRPPAKREKAMAKAPAVAAKAKAAPKPKAKAAAKAAPKSKPAKRATPKRAVKTAARAAKTARKAKPAKAAPKKMKIKVKAKAAKKAKPAKRAKASPAARGAKKSKGRSAARSRGR